MSLNHVLEERCGAALLKPKAIMQCPYAMHVQARWRDTCQSEICDECEERDRQKEREEGEAADSQGWETVCAHAHKLSRKANCKIRTAYCTIAKNTKKLPVPFAAGFTVEEMLLWNGFQCCARWLTSMTYWDTWWISVIANVICFTCAFPAETC